MNEITVSARGIEKTYYTHQPLTVLQGVDLSLRQGEMIAIVGASGTGKTTLLHILGCLDRPTSGQLLFREEDIFTKNDQELSRFRNETVGFVFQFHHLLPEFTAIENIMMPGLIGNRDKMELQETALSLLERVGLKDRHRHRVGELSGGEQQRVALARALINNPLLLLADEPTGNLDPKTGRMVFELLREINATRPLSTVMVTHNYALAAIMDRRFVLADGGLHEREVLDTPLKD